jgi:hypothetical protein
MNDKDFQAAVTEHMRFLQEQGATLREIAKAHGISHERVRQRLLRQSRIDVWVLQSLAKATPKGGIAALQQIFAR